MGANFRFIYENKKYLLKKIVTNQFINQFIFSGFKDSF